MCAYFLIFQNKRNFFFCPLLAYTIIFILEGVITGNATQGYTALRVKETRMFCFCQRYQNSYL